MVAALGPRAGLARADGDPASDVLVSQNLFLPEDAGLSQRQQAQLGLLLAQTQQRGYPLRVAVIASATDLGAVTALWRHPAAYAQYLGVELSFVYKGHLLIVMPSGFGLYDHGGSIAHDAAALAGVQIPPGAGGLGPAALTAIRRLAAASGVELANSNVTGSPAAGSSATGPSTAGSSDAVAWLAFVAGLLLIAAAWTASARAQPLEPRLTRPGRPRS